MLPCWGYTVFKVLEDPTDIGSDMKITINEPVTRMETNMEDRLAPLEQCLAAFESELQLLLSGDDIGVSESPCVR